jgi:uncharacterized membrane protein YidH (DUF202 family)
VRRAQSLASDEPAGFGSSYVHGRRALPLLVLGLLLAIVEPLGMAYYASGVLASVVNRGTLAVLLLIARLAITGIGVAAGLSLWGDRPGALAWARAAVALTGAGVVLTAMSPTFPHNRPPGLTAPLLAALLAYYGAWFAYLTRLIRM